ncbi:MAG: serine hydrolase [Burkholderiales bacterium]|nr:serine hydrolase [Burkholderiales bacterium]
MRKITLLLTLCGFIGCTFATINTTTPVGTKYKHTTTHKKHRKNTKKLQTTKHKKKHGARNLRTTRTPRIIDTEYSSIVAQKKSSSSGIPRDFVDQGAVSRQPRLYSYAAIALNANTGEIVVSKNPHAQLPIASITKLMTAMVLLDSGVSLDDYVTVTSDDIDKLRNTFSRLKVGMQFRRRDLLLLALMSSENRAAHALARTAYADGLSVFVRKMNEKAKSLGMNNTQFYDPTGLTNQNKSTAIDLSKMVQQAYTYESIRRDTTTKDADVMFGAKYVHRYRNTDVLVRGDNLRVELSKTGFINEAGHCLALYSTVNNKPIVMVFLNSAGQSGRIIDAMAVKNYVEKMRGQS